MNLHRLTKIDFDGFKLYNSNPRDAFESLSYFLFCRRFGISNGIFRYKNQTGIEVDPIKVGRDLIGFQSKFFEDFINKDQLIDSLKKAKGKHPKLNKLVFYVNKEFSEGRKAIPQNQRIVEEAKKLAVKIEWVVPSNFEILLNQPKNFDLAQFYFGEADQFGFIKNGASHKVQTFLQSDEYLNLPLADGEKILKRPVAAILRSKQKSFLLTGHPGSGKSVFTHFLFREFGGLSKGTESRMIQVLVKNQAVPMLINLKDCTAESLENLIRARQSESNVRGRNLGFIYLLDGLDELTEGRADQVLSFVKDLEQQSTTRKIIISCRSGNLNRIKVPVYLNQIKEFQFCDLDPDYIDRFFVSKKDKGKIKSLNKFRKLNQKVLDEIRDILLVRLLWETIEQLGQTSTVADLIEQKVNLLLNNPDHKKNVDNLNLLDAKSDEIIALNQDISFRFQEKFQYRFPRKELQAIVLDRFPRLDYKSANEILNYLSNLFFDRSSPDPDPGADTSFIYQHRRYQEFFFAQRLKIEYEKNPSILRNLDILSNRDFFEGYFLPYVRKEYERKENIVGLLDLNLIDVYLGNHRGYGVDDAYYLNSSEFIPALANQNTYLIDELLESENFQIKQILFIDLIKLKEKFCEWQKDKDGFRFNDYLSSIWSTGLSFLLEHIVIFWKEGNREVAQRLMDNFNETISIYEKNKYLEQISQERKPDNPQWKRLEDHIFILTHIRGKKAEDIFENLIRKNYKSFDSNPDRLSRNEEGKNKLVKSFFRVILKYKSASLLSKVDQMDDYEIIALLDVLRSYGFIGFFVGNKKLQSKIKSSLVTRGITFSEDNFFISFYKRFLNIPFSKDESNLINKLQKELRNERRVDWDFRDAAIKLAVVSFGSGENTFEGLRTELNDHFRYYDELALYAALFDSFVKILQGEKTISQTLREYLSYVAYHDQHLGGLYLKKKISFLWAEIFSISNGLLTDDLIILKSRLLQDGTNIASHSFHYHLASINKELFDKIVNETDLIKLESVLGNYNDYQSLVNDYFSLSIFYSRINEKKSRSYFIKGLKNSVLRHGWRKDTLVSYQLVDGLEILWRNNCETREKLAALTNEVFDLALRVSEFTDGKGTWNGPYNVVDIVAKYDIELADALKKSLIDKKGYSNFSNSVVTSVLLGRVRLGSPLEDIEKEMSKFRKDYDYEGKPNSGIYEQKITVYVAIAESDLYEDQEKMDAFHRAYDLVEEMKKENLTYYLNDDYFSGLKARYFALCRRFAKILNVEIKEENGDTPQPLRFSEKEFVKNIVKFNTKHKIANLYKRIDDYNDRIVLTKKDSWEALLNQTYKVFANIKPFIELLNRSNFPHSDFYTENSQYLHFGLAIALSDINMKAEAIGYLTKNTGHGGFANMMRVYEVIGDKQMCRRLFVRYLQLCHFLSD